MGVDCRQWRQECGRQPEELRSRMRKDFRRIIYVDPEIHKSYIKDNVEGERVNQVLKFSRGKKE